jgi:hypothetical protein
MPKQRRNSMENWILAVDTNSSDRSREQEFNDWYDRIHLPDVLSIAEVLRASRYERKDPVEGQGKFVALYEIETDDIERMWETIQEKAGEWRRQGRISELLEIVSTAFCRQITPPVASSD